jgi:hypothetical protein
LGLIPPDVRSSSDLKSPDLEIRSTISRIDPRPLESAARPIGWETIDLHSQNQLTGPRGTSQWQADQRRKGAAAEPYINDLPEVSSLVASAGADTNTIVAALLHDAVEDQRIAPAVIAREFGTDVASIVLEVTDDKALPKAERKALQIATAAKKSEAAKMIKLADKTSNVRAVANCPPADWSVARRQEYISWAAAVVGGLRGVSPFLEAEFDTAVEKATARDLV